MKASYKKLIIIAFMVAVLIIAQCALSALNGIEIVTVLLASFVFCFGLSMGLATINVFIVFRCLVFGFYPSVMLLYIVYYNLFGLVFGVISKLTHVKFSTKSHILVVLCGCFMTAMLTLLDDIITPLYFGFTIEMTKAYCLMSLTAVVPQIICTLATMIILFPILVRVFRQFSIAEELKGNEYRTL